METNNASSPLAIARKPLLGCATFSAGPFQDISEGFPRFFEALLTAVPLDNAHHQSATHFNSGITPISATPDKEPASRQVSSPAPLAFPVDDATPAAVVIEVANDITATDEAAITTASTSDCAKLLDDLVTAECTPPTEDTSIPDISESPIDHVSTAEISILSAGIATSPDTLAELASHLADLTPAEEPVSAELTLVPVEAFTVNEVRDSITETDLAAEVAELVTIPCSEDTSSVIQGSIAVEETTPSETSTTSVESSAITVTEPVDTTRSEPFTAAESTESITVTITTEPAESVAITTAIEPVTVVAPEPVTVAAPEPVAVAATEPVIATATEPEPLIATASESTTTTSGPINISATCSVEPVATLATEPVPESTIASAEPTNTTNDLPVIETSSESLLEHSAATEELVQPTSSEDTSSITENVTVVDDSTSAVTLVAAEPTVAIDISGNAAESPLKTRAPITILSAEHTTAIDTTQEAEAPSSPGTNELATEPTQDSPAFDMVVVQEPSVENFVESNLENRVEHDSEDEPSWEAATPEENTLEQNIETAPDTAPVLVTVYPLILEDDFDAAASSIFNTEFEPLFDTDIAWSIPQIVEKGKSERDTVRERLTKKTTTQFNLQNLRLEKAAQALSLDGTVPINIATKPAPALALGATPAMPIIAQQPEVPADAEGNTTTPEVFSDNEEAIVDMTKDIATGGHSRTGSSSSDESKLSAGAVFDSAPCPGTPVTEYCMTPPKSHADEAEKVITEPTADMKATDAVGSTNDPEEAAADDLSQDEDETTK